MAVKDQYLTEVAAESAFTREELATAAEVVEQTLQDRLLRHYERAQLRGGTDYWLLRIEQGNDPGVWLAFTIQELKQELREPDYDVESGQLSAVAIAYLEQFQAMGYTVGVPGSIARSIKDPVFYPIYVGYPEGWKDGEYNTLQRFQRLLARFDLSPAEALDYWAMERMNKTANDWSSVRGVDPEAVRKNVRQAEEKIQTLRDDDTERPYETNRLRVVDLEELPSGDPHDPDKDMFYVPMDDFHSD
jgi:hypothetical protein